uniref:Uncharacterized protein n=1 Tax=Moumouvirus sp. 'Monve' TaxID=1128131 RepID=H2ED22_9VIRU|nr:hypothetical protein mv_R90 [Moumouvirus Monve]
MKFDINFSIIKYYSNDNY